MQFSGLYPTKLPMHIKYKANQHVLEILALREVHTFKCPNYKKYKESFKRPSSDALKKRQWCSILFCHKVIYRILTPQLFSYDSGTDYVQNIHRATFLYSMEIF